MWEVNIASQTSTQGGGPQLRCVWCAAGEVGGLGELVWS